MLGVRKGWIHHKTSARDASSRGDLEEPRARLAIGVGIIDDDTLAIIQGLLYSGCTFLPRAQGVSVNDAVFWFGRMLAAEVTFARAGVPHQKDHLSEMFQISLSIRLNSKNLARDLKKCLRMPNNFQTVDENLEYQVAMDLLLSRN